MITVSPEDRPGLAVSYGKTSPRNRCWLMQGGPSGRRMLSMRAAAAKPVRARYFGGSGFGSTPCITIHGV
jgi:hypothetical protein